MSWWNDRVPCWNDIIRAFRMSMTIVLQWQDINDERYHAMLYYLNRESWSKLEVVRFSPDASGADSVEQNRWNCKLFGNLKFYGSDCFQTILIPDGRREILAPILGGLVQGSVASSLDLSLSSNFLRVLSSCLCTFRVEGEGAVAV
jgi:hypothetical protein